MTDILVRGLTPEEVGDLDRKAKRLGTSRQELLRRWIRAGLDREPVELTAAALDRFAAATQDLADPEVMKGAWD